MMLPNFLIIGAARSGTTSLHTYLREHLDIYLPKRKQPEPHFFLKPWEYSKGLGYYSEQYFSDHRGEHAVGEASSSYLYQPYVAARIRKHLPSVKIIAILRHPVNRAYSNYKLTVENGLEPLSFDEAISIESDRIRAQKDPFWKAVQPHAYIDRGYYYRQLQIYFNEFDRDEIQLIRFKDFITNTRRVIQEVFSFLGVEKSFLPPSLGKAFNESNGFPPMQPETRQKLLRIYRKENEKLAALLGWDLSEWNC